MTTSDRRLVGLGILALTAAALYPEETKRFIEFTAKVYNDAKKKREEEKNPIFNYNEAGKD